MSAHRSAKVLVCACCKPHVHSLWWFGAPLYMLWSLSCYFTLSQALSDMVPTNAGRHLVHHRTYWLTWKLTKHTVKNLQNDLNVPDNSCFVSVLLLTATHSTIQRQTETVIQNINIVQNKAVSTFGILTNAATCVSVLMGTNIWTHICTNTCLNAILISDQHFDGKTYQSCTTCKDGMEGHVSSLQRGKGIYRERNTKQERLSSDEWDRQRRGRDRQTEREGTSTLIKCSTLN